VATRDESDRHGSKRRAAAGSFTSLAAGGSMMMLDRKLNAKATEVAMRRTEQ
jgi:hypothetical protein